MDRKLAVRYCGCLEIVALFDCSLDTADNVARLIVDIL